MSVVVHYIQQSVRYFLGAMIQVLLVGLVPAADRLDALIDAQSCVADYAIHVHGAEHATAINIVHDMRLTFDQSQTIITTGEQGWQLGISAMGREGTGMQILPAGELSCAGQRVERKRSGSVEWFVNRPSGIEHGFTIDRRPDGAGDLRLMLTLDGAKVEGDGSVCITAGSRRFTYDHLSVVDSRGRHLPATLGASGSDGIAITIDDVDATYPVVVDPILAAGGWHTGLGINGVNGLVSAIICDHGDVYVGGSFTVAGTAVVNHVAKWNGMTWSSLGGGTNKSVSALALDATGQLYAGGSFTAAGMAPANGVARWDGTEWHALGSGIGGLYTSVQALTFSTTGQLYVGGSFTSAGGLSANHIARWNGNTWSALGSGIDGQVNALAFDGSGNLYAGGTFANAGGNTANNIAKWNGSAWSRLGTVTNNGVNNQVMSLVARGSNVYAGGFFNIAGNGAVNYVAKWNGSAWSSVGNQFNYLVWSLAMDAAGTLYAGGEMSFQDGLYDSRSLLARWTGSEWVSVGKSMPIFPGGSGVGAIALDGNGRLYAGGQFTLVGGGYLQPDASLETGTVPVSNIASFAAGAWSTMGSGINGPVNDVAVDASGTIYLAGDFSWPGCTTEHNILRWNGTGWSALGTGLNGYLRRIVIDPSHAGVVYAGGNFDYYVQKWDGSAWSHPLPAPNAMVHAMEMDTVGNLVIGGNFTQVGSLPVGGLAKWNGTAWNALGTGTANVRAILIDPSNNVYALGEVADPVLGTQQYLRRWNGTTWTLLGAPLNGEVMALARNPTTGDIYAGGQFRLEWNGPADYIAQWNGTAWYPLGNTITGVVDSLAIDVVGNVYAGCGNYGADPAGRTIARWNGEWNTVGEGTDREVDALAQDGVGNLYIGGRFVRAGGTDAAHIARWDGEKLFPLSSGTNGPVATLAADLPRQRVYAAGSFTTAGGTTVANIASWNGQSWAALGSGLDASVAALLLDANGDLYAGGGFTHAGGISVDHLARWNGSAWSGLGGGLDGPVYSLARSANGKLYAGGDFLRSGTLAVNRLACWSGGEWTALSTGLNGTVSALACDSAGHLYVGGRFTTAGSVLANYIAKWDGIAWSALGSGMNGPVTSLTWSGTSLMVGGDFTTTNGVTGARAAWWDGSVWMTSPTGDPDERVTAVLPDGVGGWFLGGDFSHVGGRPATHLAHYASGTFSALATVASDSWVNDLLVDRGQLTVAGEFTRVAGIASSRVAIADLPTAAPTIAAVADRTTKEDVALGSIILSMADDDSTLAELHLSAVSSDPLLVLPAGFSFSGSGANRTLTITPAANRNGNALITVAVDDGSNEAYRTFALAVTPVNDAPTFVAGANLSLAKNSAANVTTGWATSINSGPVDESGQLVDFQVSNSMPSLFAVPPVISAAGTLSFTPAPGQVGTATITVKLHDNGGTANGGSDLSLAITRTITVVNTPPVGVTAYVTVAPGATVTGTLQATDADGDTVSGYAIVTPSPDGTVSITDAATGAYTFVPASTFTGSTTFSFSVSDGSASSAPATVTITKSAGGSAGSGGGGGGSSSGGCGLGAGLAALALVLLWLVSSTFWLTTRHNGS